MNRRNFLFATAAPALAPLAASVFAPLRAHGQDARPSDSLKITRVEPHVLRVGRRAAVPCCRIETAEGIHGWGEATSPPTTPAIITQIRESGKLLIGKSAWDIEGHWTHIYTTEFNTLGGTLYAAMSAIDIALWDIVGKKLGVPVYRLLGGRAIPERQSLRIYASGPWGEIPRTREAYAAKTKEVIARGATAGKFDPFGGTPKDRQLPTTTLNEVRQMVQGVREGGPDFDICIEAHGKFNVASAGRIAKMLEPFDPFFLEEPVPTEDMDAMAAVQSATSIPIATGEGLQSPYPYRELLKKQAARILQPDAARAGGITAMKKIAVMAEPHYVNIAPHNPNGPVCTAASLHVVTSIANFVICEQGNTDTSMYNDFFTGGWKPSLSEMWVPEVPGVGVDFSPKFVKEQSVTF
jgi:galactonate dehydratase